MTTPFTARTLALIAAEQARIAGMEAENKQREACGEAMAYTAKDFFYVADELDRLAQAVINQ